VAIVLERVAVAYFKLFAAPANPSGTENSPALPSGQ